MKLLLSPHNDDESLFAAYTLMREKPIVVIITDSDMQLPAVTASQRREESRRACDTLGVTVEFLGLKDGFVKEDDLRQRLLPHTEQEWSCAYAPAIEGGHPEHDLLGRVASSLFHHVRYYSTYKDPAVPPMGEHPIVPTQQEIDLKNRALDCYASQLSLNNVRVHFDTVRGKPEYLNDSPHHDSV
jgi:LmbE family N-acetylglucosaminyl deacetylase